MTANPRAERYHVRAAELRKQAGEFEYDEARQQLLDIAEMYDRLAEQVKTLKNRGKSHAIMFLEE